MIRWFHVEPSSSCPSYTPGLYTAEQIDTLVFVDGYIPVASAAEFNAIRTGLSETMGAGTCWVGSYTTGTNKKYIQVTPIDFTAFGTWTTRILVSTTFLYNGNELDMTGLTATDSLFSGDASAYNMRIVSYSINRAAGNEGILYDSAAPGIIDNCVASGVNTGGAKTNVGGLIGVVILVPATNLTISNCHWSGTLSSGTGSNVGGIVGSATGNVAGASFVNITNCTTSGTLNGNSAIGGIAGSSSGNIVIAGCTSETNVNPTGIFAGGIIGTGREIEVIDCIYQNATLNATGADTRVGGILGSVDAGAFTNIRRCRVQNCTITANANTVVRGAGGIVNYLFSGTNIIEECEVINCTISSNSAAAGIMSQTRAGATITIRNCRVLGGTITAGNGGGGIVGVLTSAAYTVTNCFSTTPVSGTTNIGGMVGQFSGATVNASYWDTVASGNATSAAGTGQTTVALQTPTTNSGIYSAWSLAVWDFGTSVEYPELINTP